jgi:Zn-dependent M16 (insulinase) family peptidase
MATVKLGKPTQVDYDRIEPGWRAGIKSIAQLAEDYTKETGKPVTKQGVAKHFKGRGIERDLKAKIQAKADALVAAALVTDLVTDESKATEKAIVDTNAVQLATVRLEHRKDIGRARNLSMRLLEELESQAKPSEELRKLSDLQVLQKIMKEAADTLKTMITLEREAYGLATALPDSSNDQTLSDAERAVRLSRIFELAQTR